MKQNVQEFADALREFAACITSYIAMKTSENQEDEIDARHSFIESVENLKSIAECYKRLG